MLERLSRWWNWYKDLILVAIILVVMFLVGFGFKILTNALTIALGIKLAM